MRDVNLYVEGLKNGETAYLVNGTFNFKNCKFYFEEEIQYYNGCDHYDLSKKDILYIFGGVYCVESVPEEFKKNETIRCCIDSVDYWYG